MSPSRTTVWAAYLAAFGSGLAVVLLLIILWLFVDLMVSRGRLPSYDDLTSSERGRFADEWNALTEKNRKEAIELRTGTTPTTDPMVTDDMPAAARKDLWLAYEGYLLTQVYHLDDGRVAHLVLSGDPSAHNVGAWSLIIRSHISKSPLTPFQAWVVRWNPWMRNVYYRPPGIYLGGLFLLAACWRSPAPG